MPWIDHPEQQGERASVADWLRYKIGLWMQRRGSDLEHRALYPHDKRCAECGSWVRHGFTCDHIPF